MFIAHSIIRLLNIQTVLSVFIFKRIALTSQFHFGHTSASIFSFQMYIHDITPWCGPWQLRNQFPKLS